MNQGVEVPAHLTKSSVDSVTHRALCGKQNAKAWRQGTQGKRSFKFIAKYARTWQYYEEDNLQIIGIKKGKNSKPKA